jgi:hypothetical protein
MPFAPISMWGLIFYPRWVSCALFGVIKKNSDRNTIKRDHQGQSRRPAPILTTTLALADSILPLGSVGSGREESMTI